MKSVCAWCNKILREGDGNEPVSHGICQECIKKMGMDDEQFIKQEWERVLNNKK
jgi:hypothetical protein